MSDGNNIEEGALDELKEQIREQKEQIDKLVKMNDDAQSYIKRRDEEVGELRKNLDEMKEKISQAAKPEGGGEHKDLGKDGGDKSNQSLGELQASLSEDQRKAAEQLWKQLDEAKRSLIYNDEDALKEFYRSAGEAEQTAPESPWKNPQKPKQKKLSLADEVKELWNKNKEGTATPAEPGKGIDVPEQRKDKNVARGAGVLQAIAIEKQGR